MQRKEPQSTFEKNLSTEAGAMVEAIRDMEPDTKVNMVDLTATDEENRIRSMLMKDQAVETISNLFTAQYGLRKELCERFKAFVSQVLGWRNYKLQLTEVYKAALAQDEDSVSIYLLQILEDAKKEFLIQTGEDLPRAVDDVQKGVRNALRLDAGTRTKLGAGGEWAGHRLEETTKEPVPVWHKEGGRKSKHEESDWAA